ncbi:hypothetical protein [Haladaptatus cibarius]|uniref:hypothetical protein n=1 Tax=Haladaptatus cibarius TaxID=453847 RepID=UPI0006796688|nr:hypothetical protein [Haladaptatus cibarius]
MSDDDAHHSDTGQHFDRRDYLKFTGATAATAAGLSFASTTASAATTRHGISFGTVKNAVNDLGMDPNGNDPIDSQLPTNSNDLLIEFPPGEYRIQSRQTVVGQHNFGIRGLGNDPTDVRFTIPQGNAREILALTNGYNYLIENVAFDQTSDTNTGIGVTMDVSDGGEIHDVHTLGYTPNEHEMGSNDDLGELLAVQATDSDGTVVVENYVSTGECDVIDYPDNTICVFVGLSSKGTVYLRDCHIENKGEHAAYASKASAVRVEGGLFKNNANTNMRICGSGSYMKDATIVVDRDEGYFRESDTGDPHNVRGLWWENAREGASGGYIENCDFIFDSNVRSQGMIRVAGNAGGMDIRNCRFQNNTSSATTISVQGLGDGPRGYYPPGANDVDVTGCSFTGSGSVPAVDSNRNNAPVTVSDCCESMPNGGGFNGSVSTNNISHSNCPVPDPGNPGDEPGDPRGPKHDITFSGGNVDTFDYYFRATNAVEGKSGIGGEDDVGSDSGDGSTTGTGSDTYLFEQDIAGMSLNLGDYMTVHLDGSDKTITIEGVDDGYNNGYYLEVTGDLYPTGSSDNHDVEVSPNGDSVNGLVGSGSDTWEFTGELSRIGLNQGTATVDVTRRHKLEIEDYDDGVRVPYEFSVTGSVKKGQKANDSDSVSGNTASGAVTGGTDSYIFTGRITDFTHSGAIHTYVDDKEVITPSLDKNTVTIEGDGPDRDYKIAAIGGLGKSGQNNSSINSGDDISGRIATGTVSGGNDSFDYRNGIRVSPRDWGGADHYFETN